MALGKLIIWGVAGLALVGIGAMAFVRLAPLPEERFTARPGPMEAGEFVADDGIKVVVPLGSLPAEAFDRLVSIITQTPRTKIELQGADTAAFVTRSALWGFPDVAVVWTQDAHLHIHSALVYGAMDLGVNAARVKGWIGQLTE